MKTAIIGIGNPLRKDDGIGIYLTEKLKNSQIKDKATLFIVETALLNTMHKLTQFENLIFIDAGDFSEEIGKVKLIKNYIPPDIKLSTHSLNLKEIIHILKILNPKIKNFFIILIQKKDTNFDPEPFNFSKEIKIKLNTITQKVKKIIENILTNPEKY